MLVRMNSSLMTPLDVAGTHESHEAAYLIIDYFFQRFEYVEKIFDVRAGERDVTPNIGKEPFSLKYLNHKEISKGQRAYTHLNYWAGYYGHKLMIQKFLTRIGISPFMKLF